MSNITGDVIDVLVRLGLLKSGSGGGVEAAAVGGLTETSPGSGIYDANIIHRTGTIAALLALDGGNGEIGVATDMQALVRFNGAIGGARAFYRSGLMAGIYVNRDNLAGYIANNTDVPLTYVMANRVDTLGVVQTDGSFIFSGFAPHEVVGVSYSIDQSFGSSAVGSVREITLQLEFSPGVWIDLVNQRNSVAVIANAVMRTSRISSSAANASGVLKLRLAIKQDSGAAMSIGDGRYQVSLFRA